MKKILPLLALLMAGCIFEDAPVPTVAAEVENQSAADYVVSQEDALATLLSTLEAIDTPETRGEAGPRRVASHFTVGVHAGKNFTRSETGDDPDPYMHVFNFEGDEGYAVMSGDVRTPPIFMIADNGSLGQEAEIEHDGMAIFLANAQETYYDSIENFEKRQQEAINVDEAAVVNTRGEYYDPNPVYQHYSSKGKSFNNWKGTSSPYFDLLTPVKDGKRPNAGCSAVATAIIMAFHEHPTNYGGYSFDWDKLRHYDMRGGSPKPLSYYRSVAETQIARMFEQLNMSKNLAPEYYGYGTGGTGSSSSNVPRTLKNFGYSNGGKRESYNESKVIKELKDGYAVMVSGAAKQNITYKKFLGIRYKAGTNYSQAHAWVVDGILERTYWAPKVVNNNIYPSILVPYTTTFLYCNWGFGGSNNGYYLSKGFDLNNKPTVRAETVTYGQTGNFQYELTCITGIRK